MNICNYCRSYNITNGPWCEKCEKEFIQWEDHKNPSKEGEPEIGKGPEKNGLKILNTENIKSKKDENIISKTKNDILRNQKLDMNKTDNQSTSEGLKMQERVESTQIRSQENVMPPIQMLPESRTQEDRSENRIERYAPQEGFFQKELLQSTSILNESVELLHGQTKKLLIKENPEISKPSDWDIGQARLNMETVAKLIQTKVNFVKALRK